MNAKVENQEIRRRRERLAYTMDTKGQNQDSSTNHTSKLGTNYVKMQE